MVPTEASNIHKASWNVSLEVRENYHRKVALKRKKYYIVRVSVSVKNSKSNRKQREPKVHLFLYVSKE